MDVTDVTEREGSVDRSVGSGRRRFFGAFFLALGIVLLLPAIMIAVFAVQGASLVIVAPIGPIVLTVATIGGIAASIGGLRWLLGLK